METNYFGAIRCMQAVIPQMRERGSGAIINVTSVAGKISMSPMGPYSASKFALEAVSEALAQELRAFGVRVAIVEPGIIDTRMARNIEGMAVSKIYPQVRRCAAMFEATMAAGAGQPLVVGQKVREIVESGTWQLRHPVGPDAEPFLGWRRSMNDENWVQWGAQSDSDWLRSVKADFGMDVNLDQQRQPPHWPRWRHSSRTVGYLNSWQGRVRPDPTPRSAQIRGAIPMPRWPVIHKTC